MTEILDPATPATVSVAIAAANTLAYGFAKHTDDGYWNALYLQDPDYAWRRMLGWQAEGGPDQAAFGAYAVPPSPWHGTVVVPPVVVPPPIPLPTPVDVLLEAYKRIEGKLDAVLDAIAAVKAPTYEGTVQVPYLGTGKVTLTPKP